MTTPHVAATTEQTRTLAVAALGTVLALVTYTTPIATLAGTATGLGAGSAGQAWILSSMSCGLAVGLLPAGAVGDDHGRRRMFVIGAVLLAVTSVLAALASGTAVLVVARIGQGLGAAAILACSLGLIGHAFLPGPRRVHATGVWGACVGGGIALGPLLAAALDTALGWRSAYGLIALLAALLAVLAWRLLTESRADRQQAVDLPGMLLLGVALAGVLAGLVEGRSGWAQPSVIGLLVGGVVLGAVFVLVELRRGAPMLDLRLFGRPDFAGATIGALATGAGIIASMSFLPTLLQRGLGHGVVYAALLLLGWSATSVVTALLARRLPVRATPRAQLVAGLLGVAVGQVMLTGIGPGAGAGRLLPGLLVAGAASGVLNAALARQAVASAPTGLASIGSGANNTARYLGAAIGVTIIAVLATHPVAADTIAGWNVAVLVDAVISAVGALVVLACRPRVRDAVAV
ncbi:MFS transporter [Pseudonocardia sp.]|uniref:MFS transporter n=1 Tax=Pseudonocardia sp. TaxID=60912 RepID=UPI00263331B5|nr:MFS transporter [Pseudonocardia sp.]MCW2720175.1 transporter [Pseudonocardia sp.]